MRLNSEIDGSEQVGARRAGEREARGADVGSKPKTMMIIYGMALRPQFGTETIRGCRWGRQHGSTALWIKVQAL